VKKNDEDFEYLNLYMLAFNAFVTCHASLQTSLTSNRWNSGKESKHKRYPGTNPCSTSRLWV